MIKIYIVLFALFVNTLLALEPVVLTENKGEYPLGLYLEILEDKEGKLTLDDIQKPAMESLWVKSKKEVPGFGFTKSVYWVRFQIQSQVKKEYYLEIAYPHLDKIDFYTTTNDKKIIHKKTGDLLPFKERDLQYRNFVFFLNFDEIVKEHYIRIETQSSMQFPMTIWVPVTFTEKINHEMLGMGLYFGIMLVMALYNLFIWFSVQDRSYLYYVWYIATLSLLLSNYYGITYQYLWFGSPKQYNVFYPIAVFLADLSVLTFTFNYLQVKKNIPLFYKIYRILFFLLSLGTLSSFFFSYRNAFRSAVLLAIFSVLLSLSTGILMVRKKYRPARFYILAWSMFLVGAMILAIRAFGLLPLNFFTEHAVQFGSALEVILLSLGLADRINDLKRQNELAQAQVLANQKLAIENLEKGNKVKDEFLSNLSHELRTPLTVVYTYSEMMSRGGVKPEKVQKYSGMIFENAEKLNNYVSDLMLVTSIESNIELKKSKVDLKTLLSKTIEKLKPLALEKEIPIELNPIEKMELECDPVLLEKAIAAIVKNAIVFNKQNGKIFVEIRNVGTGRDLSLRFQITDTGIGIGKEFHEKIFEKFFRVDSSLTYEVSGVGLGLFIAKRIVELHGGSIELKSELGVGSEVTVSLPL